MKVAKLLRKMGMRKELAKLAGILMDSEGEFIPEDVLAKACGVPADKIPFMVEELESVTLGIKGSGHSKRCFILGIGHVVESGTGKRKYVVTDMFEDVNEALLDPNSIVIDD